MDPDRARLLRQPDDRVLDHLRARHHQVGQLVDHDQQVRKRLLPARAERTVRLGQIAGADDREPLVAALHLGDDVREDGARLLRVRDDRRQEVRDRLVVVELDPLRVDQDHPHLVRGRAEQDRGQDRVDAAGLARAGRAGDQDVRHPGQIRPDGVAGDVLAEPDGERARAARQVVVDVAERDDPRREVRHLDADRLLAGNRREDPDLRRRERVAQVVLEPGDLRDLRARGELELVARDPRSGDLTDDRRLDPEVGERVHEHLGGPRVRLRRVAGHRRRELEHLPVREDVLRRRAVGVEHRLLPALLRRVVGRERRWLEHRRSLGRDHIRVVVDDVHGRLGRRGEHRAGLRLDPLALEPIPGSSPRSAELVPGEAEQCPRRGAGEDEGAGKQGCEADEERAGATEEGCDRPTEGVSDEAAVARPEHRHQADERDREPDSERSDIDERASAEHQAADRDEDHGNRVRSAAEQVAQARLHLLADDPARPAEVEERREEEP